MTTPPLDRMSHNHGPDGGPGLACREHRTGDCIIQALMDRAEAAEKKVAKVEALVVTAEDAPIEYRNSIQTSHLRAALDGGA